jgi:hypothetical protein
MKMLDAALTSGDSECMTYSQTWTATYTDACLNAAVPVVITLYMERRLSVTSNIDYRYCGL